jgi:outer membrane protein TolC
MKKRAMLWILMISVSLLSFSSFSAADESVKSVVVTADNIEQLVLKYNLDAASAKLSLDKAREDYEDLKDTVEDLEDNYDAIDTSTPGGMSASVSAGLQLTSLRSSKTNAAYGLKSAEIQYNQLVSGHVSAATELYTACLSDKITNDTSDIKLASLKRDLDLAKTTYEKGYMSRKKYDDLSDQLQTQIDEMGFEDEHTASRLESLRVAIGVPYGTPVEVEPLGEVDFSPIGKLVYEDELAAMLGNSTDIDLKELDLEKAKTNGSKSEYSIKNSEIALEQTREKVISDFNTQFDALVESYKRFLISSDDLKDTAAELTLLRSKFDIGRASNSEVLAKKDEYQLAELKLSADKAALYTKYLAYQRTKAGY